ncbi:Histone H2A.J [Zostera marina]|uniref:Histone H2A n=1 Tax=Zostera marina TaxID=29655 RepID=A0A0K9PW42_ZOSMR|nr:Histone H2A.J [Zostera marina]
MIRVRRKYTVVARGKGRLCKKRSSDSTNGKLQFPMRRIHRYLKDGNVAKRIGVDSAVFLAAAVEYIIGEILDVAAAVARNHERARINKRHLALAIYNDKELNGLFKNVAIIGGGVLPNIEESLLPIKKTPTKRTPTRKTSKRARTKKAAVKPTVEPIVEPAVEAVSEEEVIFSSDDDSDDDEDDSDDDDDGKGDIDDDDDDDYDIIL